MPDYTYTAEEIRDIFAQSCVPRRIDVNDERYDEFHADGCAFFDRWLAEVKAETLDFAATQIRVDETGDVADWLRATANLYRESVK